MTNDAIRGRAVRRARETAAIAFVLALGCELADFDVVRSSTVTIPHERPPSDFELMEFDDIDVVLAELDDTEDVDKSDLSDAQLDRLTLHVVDHPDLAFVQRIEVYAIADDLPRVRIAMQDEFPRGESTIELEPDDVDLRAYVAAPTVTIVAHILGEPPRTDVQVAATATLHIGVTTRGACHHM